MSQNASVSPGRPDATSRWERSSPGASGATRNEVTASEIGEIFERNFCPRSRIRGYHRRRSRPARSNEISSAGTHAAGINSDRRRSVIHCHRGPKRVYDRTDEKVFPLPPSLSLLPTKRPYDVTLLRSRSLSALARSIDRNFRQ